MPAATTQTTSSTLPACSEIALAHSQKLVTVIRDEIESAGGWISFARFMELALYQPGLGYYNGGSTKLGASGDFVTAPEISTLYGCALARQVRQTFEQNDDGNILEFGAGSGKLALDLLLELELLDCLPRSYKILEVSAQLRERQQTLFSQKIPHLMPCITWLDRMPDQFSGIILANEVVDAMPVHLIEWQGDTQFEKGVLWQGKDPWSPFAWQNRPIENEALKTIATRLAVQINPEKDPAFTYVSEINLAARHFIRSLSDMLQRGVIILIDYGFGGREYYHPQRNQGTLMCHYRHRAHSDPFYLPGLQDITSHVDFSALSEAAEETHLQLLGYSTQAHFLLNSGITEILARTPPEDVQNYLPLANQLQKLVSPSEMGEMFKVMAFGKNIQQPLLGFVGGDKRRML